MFNISVKLFLMYVYLDIVTKRRAATIKVASAFQNCKFLSKNGILREKYHFIRTRKFVTFDIF